jgi:hypothetical protein
METIVRNHASAAGYLRQKTEIIISAVETKTSEREYVMETAQLISNI